MATVLARAMVTQYGMSDKLGPLAYGDNEEEVFLGHSIARTQNLSDETQTMVDEEIHRMVDEAYRARAQDHHENLDDLHAIARGLLEYETLSGEEIKDLLKGKPPVREFTADVTARPARPLPCRPPDAARGRRPEPDTGRHGARAFDLRRWRLRHTNAMPGLAPGILLGRRSWRQRFVLSLAHGDRKLYLRPLGFLYGAAAVAAVADGLGAAAGRRSDRLHRWPS